MIIITGKISRGQRVGLYGPEGIGKSSLAVRFPKPLFLDNENGTDQPEVSRVSGIHSWEEQIVAVGEICRERERRDTGHRHGGPACPRRGAGRRED